MWSIDERKFLSPLEVKHLRANLAELAKSGRRRNVIRWMVVDLGLSSGLRASEMAALNIEDCFLSGGQSSILVKNGKGGKTASVLISDKLRKHLKQFISWRGVIGGRLFLNERGQPYTRIGLYKMVKKIFSDFGLSAHYSIHSLRHTFCSSLYRVTKDLRLVQRQARHSSPNVTTVYANLLDEEVKNGMEQLFGVENLDTKHKSPFVSTSEKKVSSFSTLPEVDQNDPELETFPEEEGDEK